MRRLTSGKSAWIFNTLLMAGVGLCAWGGVGRDLQLASAVELLQSGGFEASAILPAWSLSESITGSSDNIDSAEVVGFSPDTTPSDLWLKAFAGGGPLKEAQGNFDLDSLPGGDVDGVDFLTWQRGFGTATAATASQGDADADGDIDDSDFNRWRDNFGTSGGRRANAVLSQTVPASPGVNYTLKGSSRWESNYSGGVATLDAGGPLGAVASPTSTTIEMAFLDASGAVIGTPVVRDLRTEQSNLNFWVQHTLNGVAPAQTASVRVTAAARDMVWNGAPTNGSNQSAFFDSFTLTGDNAPTTEKLLNPGLDERPPSGLDLWTQVEVDPENPEQDEILRTASFANNTPGGTTGVWLSSFLGSVDQPVDGTFFQTVAGVPGANYVLSGSSRFEGNYAGGVNVIGPGNTNGDSGKNSPTQTLMELAFLDGADAVIGTPIVLDVKADRILQSGNANDGQWRRHTLNGTAPAGTAKVRVSGILIDGVANINPQQSAFFDDFSLDGPLAGGSLASVAAVPEPSTALGMTLMALLCFHRTSRRNLA